MTVTWKGGTVLAGRSLRLVEQRETTAELIAGVALPATLAAASVLAAWLWPEGETRALTDPPHETRYSLGVSLPC